MRNISVAGVTYQGRQGIIKKIIKSYNQSKQLIPYNSLSDQEILEETMDGSIYEDQWIEDIVEFVPEPDNPHDPNAIMVMVYDASEISHHIGYIPKKDIAYLKGLLGKPLKPVIEFAGGEEKYTDFDDNGNEILVTQKENWYVNIQFLERTEEEIKALDTNSNSQPKKKIGCLGIITIFIFIIILISLLN